MSGWQSGAPSRGPGIYAAMTPTSTDAAVYGPPVDRFPRLTDDEAEDLANAGLSVIFTPGENTPTVASTTSATPSSNAQQQPSYASRADQTPSMAVTVQLAFPTASLHRHSRQPYLTARLADVAAILSTAALTLEAMPRKNYWDAVRSIRANSGSSAATPRDALRHAHGVLIGKLAYEISGHNCNNDDSTEMRAHPCDATTIASIKNARSRLERGARSWVRWSPATSGLRSQVALTDMSAPGTSYRGDITWIGEPSMMTTDGEPPDDKNYILYPPRRDLSQPPPALMQLD